MIDDAWEHDELVYSQRIIGRPLECLREDALCQFLLIGVILRSGMGEDGRVAVRLGGLEGTEKISSVVHTTTTILKR